MLLYLSYHCKRDLLAVPTGRKAHLWVDGIEEGVPVRSILEIHKFESSLGEEELQASPIIEKHPLSGWIACFKAAMALSATYPLDDDAVPKLDWACQNSHAAHTGIADEVGESEGDRRACA